MFSVLAVLYWPAAGVLSGLILESMGQRLRRRKWLRFLALAVFLAAAQLLLRPIRHASSSHLWQLLVDDPKSTADYWIQLILFYSSCVCCAIGSMLLGPKHSAAHASQQPT